MVSKLIFPCSTTFWANLICSGQGAKTVGVNVLELRAIHIDVQELRKHLNKTSSVHPLCPSCMGMHSVSGGILEWGRLLVGLGFFFAIIAE